MELREKVCGANGSIFWLFIPGFWALFENIETHFLFAFLEFSIKKIYNFFCRVPRNYIGDNFFQDRLLE